MAGQRVIVKVKDDLTIYKNMLYIQQKKLKVKTLQNKKMFYSYKTLFGNVKIDIEIYKKIK
jgi:hypothetical protein